MWCVGNCCISSLRTKKKKSDTGSQKIHPLDKRRCTIVTLGRDGELGRELLKGGRYKEDDIIDLSEWLPDECHSLSWGYTPETQEYVRALPGFDAVFELVIGQVMFRRMVVIACSDGRHRSVAVAELAKSYVKVMKAEVLVDVIHADAGKCDDEQWDALIDLFGAE